MVRISLSNATAGGQQPYGHPLLPGINDIEYVIDRVVSISVEDKHKDGCTGRQEVERERERERERCAWRMGMPCS